MEKTFWQAVKSRRSRYGFTKERPVSKEKIEEILRDALNFLPSAYNSQSTRLVLLWGDEHKKLWEIVKAELEKVVQPENFAGTAAKIDENFASGYGTVLFYEDGAVVKGMQESFPLYAFKFPEYSAHTNAMHQFVIWTALSELGLGASLQHYSPLIDGAAAAAFDIPADWKLIAQMPFGSPAHPDDKKEFSDLSERLKIFG